MRSIFMCININKKICTVVCTVYNSENKSICMHMFKYIYIYMYLNEIFLV